MTGMEQRDALPEALVCAGETGFVSGHRVSRGEFEIQDIASQAVSWLCAPKPGETWWDTCAGKAENWCISDLMENKGIDLGE